MSSKNSRVKIHVGRNQKFTSKNSWSKNSWWAVGVFVFPVGLSLWASPCGPFFHVSKPLQSNGKQTKPTTGKTLARYFLLFYCDMKNKRQKQDHRTQQKQK